MNDSSILDIQALSRDATFNTLIYLGGYYDVRNGTSVNTIVSRIEDELAQKEKNYLAEGYSQDKIEKELGDDKRQLQVVQNALKNDPEMGKLVIANQTKRMNEPKTNEPYETGGLVACTFQDSHKNPTEVTVVFRGTNSGEWYDNGLGLSGEHLATDQQNQATEYFDYIIQDNDWDVSSPEIHVTGHSKGGNKAQFVAMTSQYAFLITSVYSLDGQCMSPEAIAWMKNLYGEDEYNRRREKLFAIAADNDYVNILGSNNDDGRIIPDDHIFFLKSNLFGVKWHYSDCFMNTEGSTLTEFVDQGIVSRLLQGVSEQAMDLPPFLRSIITNGAMAVAEMGLGNGVPVNGETFSYADILGMIPLILECIPGGTIEALGNELGVNTEWISNIVTAYLMLYFAPINIAAYGTGLAIDLAIAAIKKIEEVVNECKEAVRGIIDGLYVCVQKVRDWYNKTFNVGYKYATANPQIVVDTYKLNDYAQRLISVNSRVSKLDGRLDSLYWRVGLLDLWNLMQADILTGYSWRISRCASYLSDTATDFVNAENDLVSKVQ